VTVQIVRDWVVRFNARGPDGLVNGKAPGKPSLLNEDQRTALAQAIEPAPHLRDRWPPIEIVVVSGTKKPWQAIYLFAVNSFSNLSMSVK
jgi:hypothetical protein